MPVSKKNEYSNSWTVIDFKRTSFNKDWEVINKPKMTRKREISQEEESPKINYITMGYRTDFPRGDGTPKKGDGKNIVWKIDSYNYSPFRRRIDLLERNDYIKQHTKINPKSNMLKKFTVNNLYHWIGSKHWENNKWRKKELKLYLSHETKEESYKKIDIIKRLTYLFLALHDSIIIPFSKSKSKKLKGEMVNQQNESNRWELDIIQNNGWLKLTKLKSKSVIIKKKIEYYTPYDYFVKEKKLLIFTKFYSNTTKKPDSININPTDFNKCFGFIYPNDDTNVKLFTNKKTTKSTNLMYRNNIQHNILNNPTISDSSDLKFAINLKQLGNLFFNDTKDFFELDSKKK